MIEVGQTIGNYRITAKLGEGGMGIVYLAEHPVIGRKVALKAIHPELSRNPEVVSRFMTEAKSVNQIGNEHIVDVSDFGNTFDGEFYFIMEFLQGESVADRLRRERLFEGNRALQIAAQVADALSASHSHGIVHRDLKPENIFLINRGQTRDFVKVLDFGLAKLTQGEEKVSHKTRTGSVMGTPYYMSPEQCEGKAGVDHRADIYSLGVILFEMMTGRVPFGGEGYGEIIVKHLTQPAPVPSSFNPAVTPAQEAVVMRALAKSREERFSTMDEFRAAMLDPQGYIAGGGRAPLAAAPSMYAPAPARPTTVAATVGSQEYARDPQSGASGEQLPPRVSQPSTFKHAGEIYEEPAPAKSHKGLVLMILGGVAIAAMAAVFVVQNQRGANSAATPVQQDTTPAPAATLDQVKLSFSSEPAGATVVLQTTGEELGTTPFDKDFAPSSSELGFLFRKEGFQDQLVSVAPQLPGPVRASLTPVPPAPATPPTTASSPPDAPEIKPGRPARKSAGSRPKRPPPRKPTDEDAVLEPTFR